MVSGKRAKAQRRAAEAAREVARQQARTAVASVVVRCPTTDKFFPTGVASDPASFSTATFENNATRCPYCGMMHRWGDSEIALNN
jgi:hypothetical protein